MSSRELDLAKRFYRALEAADSGALLTVLDPGFHAEITVGLPHGWGGTYRSAREMLEQCWACVFAALDVRPIPEEYLPSGHDRLVVLGRYVGAARKTGAPLEAAFAHVLRFREGRITQLIQITDSARWHETLRALRRRGDHPAARNPLLHGLQARLAPSIRTHRREIAHEPRRVGFNTSR